MKKLIVFSALLVAVVAAVGIPLVTWWSSVGNPVDYFGGYMPPGQQAYILSKLAGLLAISLFWLQCLFALGKRFSGAAFAQFCGHRSHVALGSLTLIMVLLHVSLFFAAVSIRTGSPAWGLLVPKFSHGYYNQQVTLGLIAFLLLCVGAFAGWKTAIGSEKWRIGHYLWLLVLPLAFIHALSIGTESRLPIMFYFLLVMPIILFFIGFFRVGNHFLRRSYVSTR
ncbi:hypothetical protein [Microbulbifer epialgicus]|uniref:Ferric reductase like transmembrane component n=1 Tax=Microbulbifer epialgicus TaxID=393907 RepID=A0ABV4P3R8_9GAMM